MVCRNQLRIALRLVTIALLVGAAAAGYAVLRAESFLKARVIAAVESAVPHWDVRVEDVRLDGAQARLLGLKVRPRGGSEDLIEVPELVVSLSADALATEQAIIVEAVQAREPTVRLERRPDGTLSLDDLKPWPASTGRGVPLAEIQRATVFVKQADQVAQLRELDVLMTPAAANSYGIRGSGEVDEFGDVQIAGAANIDGSAFDIRLGGRMRFDDRLIQTAAAWHPTIGERIARWSKSGVQLASANPDGTTSGIAGPSSLGLTAETDLLVEFSKKPSGPIEWKATTEIVRGELDNPLFPMPLRNLTGRVVVSDEGITVEELSAANGLSGFSVVGSARNLPGGGSQKVFKITAEEVSLDGPLQRFLTPGLAKVHELLNPHGRVSIVASIDESGASVTQWQLVKLEVHNGGFACTQFPYPVTEVSGFAEQKGSDVTLEFSGKAGTRKVDITGRVIDAGPGAGFDILISTDGVPIDGRLTEAFSTPYLAKVKAAAESLNLTGKLDGMVRLRREPHALTGTRPNYRVDVGLREGTLQYTGFPYRLENATATIRFDEIDEPENLWRFTNIVAEQGKARVEASGSFTPAPRPATSTFAEFQNQLPSQGGQLSLQLKASQVPLDKALRNAITRAAPKLAPVFEELNASGDVTANNIAVSWTPGEQPTIDLPEIKLSDGQLRIRSFPFPWTDVNVTLRKDSGDRQRVLIDELNAKHRGTVLTLRTDQAANLNQSRPRNSFAEAVPDGWHLGLYGLEIRDLLLDQELQNSVPQDLSETLAILNVQRPVDIIGDLLIVDTPKRPFTIAAMGGIELPGNDATAGIDLTGVRGRILIDRLLASKGSTEVVGRIAIDQMRAFEMALSNVRGPLKYENGVLLIGAEDMLNAPPENRSQIRAEDRLTADFYGGRVGFDIRAEPLKDGVFTYDIASTMANADLNLWAADNNLSRVDMHGKMDGEIRVSGLSNDLRSLNGKDGYLTISRARLLELPAIAQMTSVLNLRPPDNTAFRHVYLNFDVLDGMFDFKRIDLYGNNLSFVGKGQAYFRENDRGRIDFNFGSYVPPNNGSIASRVWASIGDNWLYVKVGGNIGYPIITKQPRLPLFDGFKTIMRSVETGQLVAPRGQPAGN